jgi:glycosyltransferase involved in cell wall biosynthesis
VRVLLWHGYLLRGTGSNIYKANVVREWRAAGHEVLLLCQEHDVEGLDFIDAHGDFRRDNQDLRLIATGARAGVGSVTLARPSIGEVLPVYVVDHYEGFTAKQYLDLSKRELEDYVDRNVTAVTTAIERHEPDAIVVGHEVMGPYIAWKACDPTDTAYAAQLHGSALEYVVKRSMEFLDYAVQGLRGAHAVIGGSEYMIQEASSVIPGWADKAVVVNPGCDVELFRPMEAGNRAFPVVGYVGKFIPQKGTHNLIAALPLTTAPGLGAVVVGYGEWEETLRNLWRSIRSGDLTGISEIAEARDATTRALREFLGGERFGDVYRERAAAIEIEFTGRLEHGPLSRRLPTFDVLVVPSIMAEAFGMVAAEAAACGVLPIVPNHSGIGEVGAILEDALGTPGLLTFDSADPIRGIAHAIDRVLSIERETRHEMGQAIAALAHERWAWPTVARSLLEAATPLTTRP